MLKSAVPLLALLCLCGGCMVDITHTWPDGSITRYRNSRVDAQLDSLKLRMTEDRAIEAELQGYKSSSERAFEAATEAFKAVQAVAK